LATHAEIDNVFAGAPRLQAQFSDRVEDIGREPFYSWEIHTFCYAIGEQNPPKREV
jgi:hypothetical protein